MKLLNVMLWLESRRLRIHIILLGIVLLFALMILGIDSSLDWSNIDINIEHSGDVTTTQDLLQVDGVLKLLPIWGGYFLASTLAFTILIFLPFRSDQEWQQGQYQMLRMSRWTPFQVVSSRFALYLGLFWIFFSLLSIFTAIAIQVTEVKLHNHGLDFLIGTQIVALTLCPLILSLGIYIDSLRSAYYHKGLKAIVTILQIFGWMAILGISLDFFKTFAGSIVPRYELSSLNSLEAIIKSPISLSWEPIVVSAIISAILLAVSAQIHKEVEV